MNPSNANPIDFSLVHTNRNSKFNRLRNNYKLDQDTVSNNKTYSSRFKLGIIDSEEFKKAWEKQKHVFHFRFPTNQYIYNSFFVFRFYVLLFFLKKAIKFINKRQYNQRFDSFLQMWEVLGNILQGYCFICCCSCWSFKNAMVNYHRTRL